MRAAHRTQAEHARGRGRDRQLRDRARDCELRPAGDTRAADQGGRGGRLRHAPARHGSQRGAPAAARRGLPLRARARAGDDPRAAVRELAVVLARSRHARRVLGRLAVPQRRLAQPPARCHDHGHARVPRHVGRVGLVGARALLLRRRRDLLRGGVRRDDLHPPRPLLRGAREAPLGRGAARPAGARREGCGRARDRRARAPRRDRRAARRRSLRRAPGGEGCHRRPRRGRLLRGRRGAADRRADADREAAGRRRRRCRDQRGRPARRARDEGRRRYARWRRSAAW